MVSIGGKWAEVWWSRQRLSRGDLVEMVVEVVTEWLTTGRALGVGGVDS